jgi:hypothetical protein
MDGFGHGTCGSSRKPNGRRVCAPSLPFGASLPDHKMLLRNNGCKMLSASLQLAEKLPVDEDYPDKSASRRES